MKFPVWFEVDSELGRWRGLVTEQGLARLTLVERADGSPSSNPPKVPADAVRDDRHPAARQLREYFAGRRREFTLPVDLSAVPAFRRRVLEALEKNVGYGRTTTYAELARLAGSPDAARAVGSAMATNPVPIVVPCHRVLAAGRRLGGFGFGLPAKRTLLQLEGALVV
jgi:methylated-DNA-[protein]-cysteine S-methyltransferase